MSQLLKLINKGGRFKATTYQFGLDKHLNIHLEDQYADITNAETGAYIRQVGWDGLLEMGYSPAKLLAGNEVDQFMASNKPSIADHLKSGVKYIAGGLALAVVISTVGNVTGCTDYVFNKIEQDVATSTTYASIDDDAVRLIEFKKDSEYASQQLAYMRLYAEGGDQ
jgi:hypothetical protein